MDSKEGGRVILDGTVPLDKDTTRKDFDNQAESILDDYEHYPEDTKKRIFKEAKDLSTDLERGLRDYLDKVEPPVEVSRWTKIKRTVKNFLRRLF